jgi:hypothetical protein
MTEMMIRMQLDRFIKAVRENDEKDALETGLAIAGQIILDFNRIANALEKIANK